MSVMVLRTQGPAALFDDHRLVLHTSSYDAKRVRVFHACGEFVPTPSPPPPHCQGAWFPTLGCGQAQLGLWGSLGDQSRKSQMLCVWSAGISSTAMA